MDANLVSLLLFFILVFSFVPLAILELILFIIAAYKDYHNKRFHSLKRFFKQFFIVGSVFIAIFAITMQINKAPTEKDLIKNYQENKVAFNNLAKRIQTDQKKGLERIDDNWTKPEDVRTIGLTEQDVISYRKEFQKLNIPRGFYAGFREYPDSIMFIAHTSGLSISGSSEGYVYATKSPQNYFKENCGYPLEPFKNLRDYKGCNGYVRSYTIYQQIDKNWYVYEDLED